MAPLSDPSTGVTKFLDVLIIGGGLSGLIVAHALRSSIAPPHHLSFRLLEARSVLGGRLANDDKGHFIDMGGAWIWPFQQPHVKHLVSSLKIRTFQQPDDVSSTRIEGGAVQLVHKLAEGLEENQVQLNVPVVSCTLQSEETCNADGSVGSGPLVRVETSSNEVFLARLVVLAVPPRLISKHIQFDPPLSEEKQQAMASSHTWMAGVTKVALVYKNRFWDEHSSNMGLPSHLGPAFQVYDSSTKDNKTSALTFFALARTEDDKVLAGQCACQMGEAWSYMQRPDFASQATKFLDYHVQRWPKDEFISEDPNPTRIHPHPQPVRALSKSEWDGALLFAGSESDRLSPGVMEGAVGAALRVVDELKAYASKVFGTNVAEEDSRSK